MKDYQKTIDSYLDEKYSYLTVLEVYQRRLAVYNNNVQKNYLERIVKKLRKYMGERK